MLMHQQFVRIAKKYENKIAIEDRTLNRKVTYKKALLGSLLLAKRFRQFDEGFVGIMLPNSAVAVIAILGTLMSGRVPVMINYSTGAESNCEFARDKCAFKTIITTKSLLEKLNCPRMEGMLFLEDIMKSLSFIDKIKASVKAALPVDLLLKSIHEGNEDDTLLILFTSGSEKDPKAVQLTHRNIFSNYKALVKAFSFTADDIFLANLPYFHVFGQTANLWVPFCLGMTIVTYANPLDFKTICDIVREEKVTIIAGTPTFFRGYLRNSKQGDFESVRIMLSGADKCPDALRDGFLEKHNKVLLEAYGTTETSPAITLNTLESNRPGSVGMPIDGVQVITENFETGELCKPGEIGKILVKGDNVMKGYFDDFEQTSLSLRHGWYDTGDMGFLDADGYLWHVGRLKRFLKIGGEMVSLIRIEDVLEKLLPPEIECCVVEIPDAVLGARIIAVVTEPIDEKNILRKMSKQLPNIALPYKFVVIPEMPKLGSGKIDFKTINGGVRDILQKK